jgi:glycosyltransferase involved in cell wall biosynthesis
MRIAQIMAGAPAGGAELFFERLTIALAEAGDTVLPLIRRDSARAARLAAAGLAPVQLAFGGPLDLLTRGRVARAVERFAPSVAVAWMGRAASLAPSGGWVLAGRLGGYYDLQRFRACDHLIANTRGIAAWIEAQGWPAARVHHLPNFAPDLAGAAPAAVPVPSGERWVLALGRLHRSKAFDVLIRAVERLPRVHAVIAGDGPERDRLRRLAAGGPAAGRIHMIGWRSDTAALLAGASALVCPSRHEPLGNVVIEAWSAGRPVVAAMAQGPSELIAPGQDGLLAPIEDDEALADAIAAILDDCGLAQALAAAGRARYEGGFAEKPVVARWRSALAALEKS